MENTLKWVTLVLNNVFWVETSVSHSHCIRLHYIVSVLGVLTFSSVSHQNELVERDAIGEF